MSPGQINGLVSRANTNNSHNLTGAHRPRDTASREYIDTTPPLKVRFASDAYGSPGELSGPTKGRKTWFPSKTYNICQGNKRKSDKLQHQFADIQNWKTSMEKDAFTRLNVQSAKSQVIG